MNDIWDFLTRVAVVVVISTPVLYFMFREKWKQMLQRSLSTDMERLKAELVRTNAEHAASLTPQLESIKHDFQQKLEAYKVTLIAQAEAVKAQSELKKTIALRYCEIEFERLVALELLLAPISSHIMSFGQIDIQNKKTDHITTCLSDFSALGTAISQAEMFLALEDLQELNQFRRLLLEFMEQHIGANKPVPNNDDLLGVEISKLSVSTHNKLVSRIKRIGIFSGV